jgi:hypothetical protein
MVGSVREGSRSVARTTYQPMFVRIDMRAELTSVGPRRSVEQS